MVDLGASGEVLWGLSGKVLWGLSWSSLGLILEGLLWPFWCSLKLLWGLSGNLSGDLWRELRGAERSEAPRSGSSFYSHSRSTGTSGKPGLA